MTFRSECLDQACNPLEPPAAPRDATPVVSPINDAPFAVEHEGGRHRVEEEAGGLHVSCCISDTQLDDLEDILSEP
jgi:hypothetical protein